MSEVSEAQAGVEGTLDVGTVLESGTVDSKNSTYLPVLARLALRQAKPQWKSSLSDRDLQCLLQIIEVDVVPQLVSNYSPARCSPDDRLAQG